MEKNSSLIKSDIIRFGW